MAQRRAPVIPYRNPFVTALLCLVTFSIYTLYWFTITGRALRQATSVHVPDFLKVVIYPLLGFYCLLLLTAAIDASAPGTNWSIDLLYIVAMAGLFVWVIYTIYWYYLFARAVHQYTKRFSVILTFFIIIILGFIGVGILQHQFNSSRWTKKSS
ncbi:MAG TPA: hypothetical protein VFW90_02545 [Candidatus Saccharimonadales bacterium]|nr:hypothetical protein [Candidatus Saccharimonadales bacterium]